MYINLTAHSISVYYVHQFINLEQVNSTTWIADSVEGEPILFLPFLGAARIAVNTVYLWDLMGVPLYKTTYGELEGLPENIKPNNDILVCSLPLVFNAKASKNKYAKDMVSPYQVVRQRQDTNTILGCTGFTC